MLKHSPKSGESGYLSKYSQYSVYMLKLLLSCVSFAFWRWKTIVRWGRVILHKRKPRNAPKCVDLMYHKLGDGFTVRKISGVFAHLHKVAHAVSARLCMSQVLGNAVERQGKAYKWTTPRTALRKSAALAGVVRYPEYLAHLHMLLEQGYVCLKSLVTQ